MAEQGKPRLPAAVLAAGTVGLALGANFLGITSSLLSKTETSINPALNELYAVNGLRRVAADSYSLLIPSDWRPDQKVMKNKLLFKEMPAELRRNSPLQGLPDSAWVKTDSPINNLSVIKAPVMEGFGLRTTMGTPQNALNFLSKSLAPEGSGKTITVIDATESTDALGNSRYVFEYLVDKPKVWRTGRHTISVVEFAAPDLYTATVVAPEDEWAALGAQARKIALSFQLERGL